MNRGLRTFQPRLLAGSFRVLQRRWARVHDVRFVATQHSQSEILDRYRQKLDEKAKREGLGDIDELKDAYKEKISQLKKKAAVPGATAPLEPQTASQSPWPNPPPPPSPQPAVSTPSSKTTPPGIKTLDSYVDVAKIMELPQKEIESLWRLRHAHSAQTLCASVSSSTWDSIYRTARRNPQFILPGLPRQETSVTESSEAAKAEGAPIHFLQWAFPTSNTVTVMFTHLAEYKLRGEYAQPHTTLTHHLELAGPKGLVLCQGTVIEGRGVSIEEAKWLIMNMQKFYNVGDEVEQKESSATAKELKRRRRRLVEMFSQGNTEFKVEELMEEAERMG